jgi:ankyrin repeat protein
MIPSLVHDGGDNSELVPTYGASNMLMILAMNRFIRTLSLLSLLLVSSLSEEEARVEPEAKLLMACMSPKGQDNVEAVSDALALGADIDVQDNRSGQTPLMAAVLRGKVGIVELLLTKGADVTIPEKDGYTPAHGAAFQGRFEVFKLLKEHGIDVMDDRHRDGYLPFHRACWGNSMGHSLIVEYLLNQGLDPNVEGADGRRCIEMTKNRKTKEVLVIFHAEPSRFAEEDEL